MTLELESRPGLRLEVNGRRCETAAAADTPLLYVLRNDLGLKATRFGCGTEQCGACLVLVDGKPAYACTTPVSAVQGKSVTTVEGLADARGPHALQRALIAEQAAQCGYCLSGIMMRAVALLEANRDPSEADVRTALDSHLCRCGSHNRIVRAVLRAAAEMRGAA
ncbi:MAG TPA: (2Fe-2S)-binding protein [Usitatibacter sp.]|nr:(2Fe-2S)-binding protein [Usitatibacter sp.]